MPIDLFEAIYSQRAIRRFRSEPVPEELIYKILDAAIRAPSAANRQPWRFLVVTDRTLKEQVASLYKRSWDEVYGGPSSGTTLSVGIRSSATHLAEYMADVPVLIIACIGHDGSSSNLARGSSIYPAIQNLMLAARGLDLGTVITTLHKRYEAEVKGIFGIPEDVETAALIPVGYLAEDEHFGGSRRVSVKDVTYHNKWGIA